jgi:endogenous inhibitor of DNA gyrase (YacG/DUF329 family)
MEHICPICKKVIKLEGRDEKGSQKFLPFCSERCKLIDLGAWLDADYRILSHQNSQETDQDFDIPVSDGNS